MSTEVAAAGSAWPRLTLSEWEGTKDALHLWTQIVGKIRMALTPMVNHWWQVPLYVSARGLTTSLMHLGSGGLEIQFDFVEHRLDLWSTDGTNRAFALRPMSVADFFAKTMDALEDLGVSVAIVARPTEMPYTVRFSDDTSRRPYDPDAARRFWLALVEASRVMTIFRARYLGKVSPVHFFWGAADLAVSRFSGRTAPRHPGGVPNCPDRVQQLAYSHEVSSCGFWPGGSEEGSFYAYAYPAPDGFSEWPVEPSSAFYDRQLDEYILPYAAVRTAPDPDAALLDFFQTTYEAAAILAGWDRVALEGHGPSELP